jgi:hypothetical protein
MVYNTILKRMRVRIARPRPPTFEISRGLIGWFSDVVFLQGLTVEVNFTFGLANYLPRFINDALDECLVFGISASVAVLGVAEKR